MRLISVSLALLLTVPALAVSQEIRPVGATEPSALRPGDEPVARAFVEPIAALETLAPDLSAWQEDAGSTSILRQVLRVIGGAAVGAWAGYLASHVMVGSWDDQSAINRESWAAGGAAVGITLGLSIHMGNVGPRGFGGSRVQAPDRRSNRNLLTRAQIQESNAGSLYAIIRSLRPEWLRTRGTGSMRETPRGQASGTGQFDIEVTPGIATVKVYLDETYMGDQAALEQIDPALVGQVRFLSAAEATQRLGMGHIHGAIMVTIAPVP